MKVQAYNSLPGRMSEEIIVRHQPNIQISEGKHLTWYHGAQAFSFVWINIWYNHVMQLREQFCADFFETRIIQRNVESL